MTKDELDLGHLDTLTASAPKHGIANLDPLHEHHVGDRDGDRLGFGQPYRRHACGRIHQGL
jgi:hypothetical protein